MHKFKAAALVTLLCLWAVVGCTTNTNPGTTSFTTVVTTQLAVGTINDSGGILSAQSGGGGVPGTYLDEIATFRNQLGNSAYVHPGVADISPHTNGAPACNFTTGASCNVGGNNNPVLAGIGLFGYGQNPGVNGTVAAPTAWNSPGSPTGYIWDLNQFDLPPMPAAPVPVAFSLKNQVIVNGGAKTYAAGATLVSTATLPAPANPVSFVSDGAGTGGGTFTIGSIVAGATEQVLVIIGPGQAACPAAPCPLPFIPTATFPTPGSKFSAVVAMYEVKGATTTIAVADGTLLTPSPGQGPIPYAAFVVDADFPWVEAGLTTAPTPPVVSPVITNGINGQADMSVNAAVFDFSSP